MKGFKSFADHTVFNLNDGITCVVGPNGSGKSNIIDAVRWVLGEQRAKSLRGTKMEDVIFSGTKQRRSLGMCEVSLYFDKEINLIPGEKIDTVITRRMYRSGEGEYEINGKSIRLKDLRELIADTGIGREGYSVIGQGRIDEILTSSREERRQLIEEAVGITKYRLRKSEAERKLEVANQNIDRVKDVFLTIESRIIPLKKASEKAQIYLQLKHKLRDAELFYYKQRLLKLDHEKEQLIPALTDEIGKKKNLISEKMDHETNLSEIETVLAQKQSEFDFLDNKISSIVQKNTDSQNRVKVITTEIQGIIREKHTLIKNFEEHDENLEKKLSQLDAITLESKQLTSTLDALEREFVLLERKKEDLEKKFSDISTENKNRQIESITKLNEQENKFSHQDRLKKSIHLYDEKIKKLEASVHLTQKLVIEGKASLTEKREKLKQLQKMIENDIGEETTLLESLAEKTRLIDVAIEKLRKYELSIAEYKKEYEILVRMDNDYEGYDFGIKQLMKMNPSGVIGVVGNLFTTDGEYETAIEVALGRSTSNIVVENPDIAKKQIAVLKEKNLGRVTFLPISDLKYQKSNNFQLKNEDGFVAIASELIKCEDKVRPAIDYLLGRTVVARDFDSAKRLLEHKLRVVTLAGEIFMPGGSITGGSLNNKSSGLISRKRKIEEAFEKIGKLSSLRDSINKQISEEHNYNEEIKSKIATLGMRISEHKKEAQDLEVSILTISKDFEYLNDNLTRTEKELEDTISEKGKILDEIRIIAEEISKLNDDIKNMENMHSHSIGDEKKVGKEIADIFSEISIKKSEIMVFKEKISTFRVQINGLDEEIKKLKNKKEEYNLSFSDIDKMKLSLEQEVGIQENLIKEYDEQIKKSSEMLYSLSKVVDAVKSEQKIREQRIATIRDLIDGVSAEIHKLELKKTRVETEFEEISNHLASVFDISIEEVRALEPVKGDISSLKKEISELGEVSVPAIEEYEQAKYEYENLSVQLSDLNLAKTEIVKGIEILENKMIEIFNDGFSKIASSFEIIFRKLFNGGEARLALISTDSSLTSEIEIFAQPPGKKLQSMTLLSGGEKALTAIALLFAILDHKPSPFCILDEIEAALDDVNINRFADFIKQYSDNSQFIIITHRKGTMEIAQTLYGVTMEEFGVSKLIGMKLSQAEKLVKKSGTEISKVGR